MRLQFDSNLDYQREAIDAVVELFKIEHSDQQSASQNDREAVAIAQPQPHPQTDLKGMENNLGIGNYRRLSNEAIHNNVKVIQLRNGLAASKTLDSLNFSVEMETGTGKTYVYLRTLFELNQHYGFTKFIVVVPSIAIKEGVYKALQMTEEHFKTLYDNVPVDYFVYDSQKFNQVRNFATSESIQIMVINIDAFRRSFTDPAKEDKANIIHRAHDRMSGSRPIEFIQATNPIVIIDEPQSVDSTEKSREAIASLKPLCTLRYSATHVEQHHMLYRLDAVDAYERKLVKQIEVAGIEIRDGHNKAYVKLLKVDNNTGPLRAQIELDIAHSGTVARKKKWVREGTDLLKASGGRSVYDGYIISDIHCEKDNECIDFTSRPDIVRLHQAIGGGNQDEYKRLQIRRTIETHLEKEMQLRPQGIKVLSLFFIDRVAHYRCYDKDGRPHPGKYALMFEEEYARAIDKPKYRTLFKDADLDTAVTGVHDGYFAIDSKNKDAVGSEKLKESRGEGAAQADESAYSLIMRDKEKLLSFASNLKFIFSHSALREGWDNPNIFQICTLNETASVLKKRQEIGRGLRIAVNQDGERVHGFDVNRLTVMANESYEDFARRLQQEIEQEEGIKFGVVDEHIFANIPVASDDRKTAYFGVEASCKVCRYLRDKGYIDANGKVQDLLRKDLKSGNVDLPQEVRQHAQPIIAVLRKTAGSLHLKNADERQRVGVNKAVLMGEEFKALWERIKYRTTFRVHFDKDQLIEKCADEIQKNLVVGRAQLITRTARLGIDRGGVQVKDVHERAVAYEAHDYELADAISDLQNATNLTRHTLAAIMIQSKRLEDFRSNPQKYIEQVSAIIRRQMRLFIVDGIKYQKLGDQCCYAQELFEQNELYGYLKNMLESQKSVFHHVIYDSDVEEEFARAFELSEEVKVYAKLPGWFRIDTPLGGYNPDWAVLVEKDRQERLYFVVESKSSLFSDDLRPAEQAKIDCGRAHFKALESDVAFTVADNYETFAAECIERPIGDAQGS